MSLRIMRKLVRAERGQIMTLGVLGCILVAIMMLLTLNVGQALFEKIRIQQVADSAAFSLATQEARSFNFFAYTNRANVASLVAASSTHAFATMANSVPEMFNAAGVNFLIMAAKEFKRCPGCSLFCIIHCIHGLIDLGIAFDYLGQGGDLMNEMQKVDKQFSKLIKKLDGHMSDISKAQKQMKAFVKGQCTGDTILEKMAHGKEFAPQCSLNCGSIAQKNSEQYCGCFESSEKKNKWVSTLAANGTRHQRFVGLRFTANNNGDMKTFMKQKTWNSFTKKTPRPATGGESKLVIHAGEAKTVEDPGDPMSSVFDTGHEGHAEGEGAASWDAGMIHSKGFCDNSDMFFMAELGSDTNKNKHESMLFGGGCGARHDNFKCLGKGDCFTLFKADHDETQDFGQPKVFSVIKQDLKKMQGGGQGPWEVSDSGKVAMDLGGDVGYRQVQIANPGDAYAMSKALVYYHWPKYDEPKGWKEHPNFFNPYWKAKLQPFRYGEISHVLEAAGVGHYTDMTPYAPLP